MTILIPSIATMTLLYFENAWIAKYCSKMDLSALFTLLLSVFSWNPLQCHHLYSIAYDLLVISDKSDLIYAIFIFFMISSVLIYRPLFLSFGIAEIFLLNICNDRVLDERWVRLFYTLTRFSFCGLLPIAILMVYLTFYLTSEVVSLGADLFLIIITL